jgi:ribosomal protein L40E
MAEAKDKTVQVQICGECGTVMMKGEEQCLNCLETNPIIATVSAEDARKPWLEHMGYKIDA